MRNYNEQENERINFHSVEINIYLKHNKTHIIDDSGHIKEYDNDYLQGMTNREIEEAMRESYPEANKIMIYHN